MLCAPAFCFCCHWRLALEIYPLRAIVIGRVQIIPARVIFTCHLATLFHARCQKRERGLFALCVLVFVCMTVRLSSRALQNVPLQMDDSDRSTLLLVENLEFTFACSYIFCWRLPRQSYCTEPIEHTGCFMKIDDFSNPPKLSHQHLPYYLSFVSSLLLFSWHGKSVSMAGLCVCVCALDVVSAIIRKPLCHYILAHTWIK